MSQNCDEMKIPSLNFLMEYNICYKIVTESNFYHYFVIELNFDHKIVTELSFYHYLITEISSVINYI